MPEAYIYDHVRTRAAAARPMARCRGHRALALATVPLQALKERNNLGKDIVDDVVLGVVDPVGEGRLETSPALRR
jgi:acetyl-CoA C-acetyltransferase